MLHSVEKLQGENGCFKYLQGPWGKSSNKVWFLPKMEHVKKFLPSFRVKLDASCTRMNHILVL